MTKKGRKLRLIILISVISILVALISSLNLILESVLRNAIDEQIEIMSEKSNKLISIDKVKLNIFARTITLKNISITPDSILFDKLKQGKLNQASIMKISIPVLKFQGFKVLKLAMERDFSLRKILVKGAEFTIYKNDLSEAIEKDKNTHPPFSADSIYIKGLNGINLGKVIVEESSYTTINIISEDTILFLDGSDFEIRGFVLESYENSKGFFRFNNEKLMVKMRQQRIDLKDANYFIYLKKLDFSFSDSLIAIRNFKVKPTRNRYKLGASYKYTKEVFDVEIKSINIYGYKIGKALRHGIIDIDSIMVDGLKLNIYKDKNRPFDENKRPLFIQQQLKQLKQPLHIKKVIVRNSNFNFVLRPENSIKLMKVDIGKIEANFSFITSFADSLKSGKELELNLKGILMGTSSLKLDVMMPYNSPVDTFYFSGELVGGDFAKFNPALYPVTGIKFKGGKLNIMRFYAHASPKSAKGLMTLLYSNLKAEILKKDIKKDNKILSFGANAVIRTSNPNKKGKTRVAIVKTDRVLYKGFGNLLWKSVQSGLINTILPTGKTHKEEKELIKQQEEASKAKTKKKWWKKKK